MKLAIYQVDAFAESLFEGNPAAVIPLKEWLDDKIMQAIAQENNLAETAFFVQGDNSYQIRWFTPVQEVRLCGHATLASAFVLFNILGCISETVHFESKSGTLSVSRTGDQLTLDFPMQPPRVCEPPEYLLRGLGRQPSECLKYDDYIAVFDSENDIKDIVPDLVYLEKLDLRGVIVTARSSESEFVARFFAPKYGIPEDPVTGSAYTQLMPYWSGKTGQVKLRARQVSSRGGKLLCEVKGNRVLITGSAVQYMEGTIEVGM